MMCYLKNLWMALMGMNPYREKMECMQKAYDKSVAAYDALNELYCTCVDKIDDDKKLIVNYQALTENLRQRIMDKEVLMQRMKWEYMKRIEDYNLEIERLKNH